MEAIVKVRTYMNTKKIANAVILVPMLFGLSFGQWSRTSPNVYLSTSSDKVGIGVNNPFNKLDIAGTVGLRDNDLLLRGTSSQDLNHGLILFLKRITISNRLRMLRLL